MRMITNIRSLCPEDPHLTKVEENRIETHQEPYDRIREDEMIRILTKAGSTLRK
jgi:hypothetical protein